MRYTSKTVEKLVDHYREISLLGKISGVLDWDLNVNLPVNGAEGRARQSAYVTKLISDKWLDINFRRNLEKAQNEKSLTLSEKAIIRNLSHSAKYYHKVPQAIVIEFSEETSRAFMAWREAREKNDFKLFEPSLRKIVNINQIIAEKLGHKDSPYDALLDLYEPGLTATECKEVFSVLTEEIRTLLARIKKTKTYKEETDLLTKEYPVELQKKIADFVLRKIGYDFSSGRMDISAHPFTTELGERDIRITNRYSPHNFIESLMVAMHEGGHALYEQGVNGEFAETPLQGGVSLGIHESQSRFWENQVGRSLGFIKYVEPVLKAFYPEQLTSENPATLGKVFNKVSPGLIRVEADEVTYNLHIALRFEIEEGLISGKIKVEDLPEIWSSKMKEYLGVSPDSNTNGVLQDVHWSHGSFGYFPTYTLGNLYAAQLTHFMNKKINTRQCIESGDFGTILSWQRENIHRFGSLLWPKELVKRITGERLKVDYFVDYITAKYGEIYN